MAWGLLPLYFAAAGLGIAEIGLLAAIYPAVWGLAQLGTGALSDRFGRKSMLVCGMWLQAGAILTLVVLQGFAAWLGAMVALGLGTALVYPVLLAVIADVAHPDWRASAVGVYRLWRDGGYVIGAVLAGVVADILGLSWAIAAVGLLTFASGVVVRLRMCETLRSNAALSASSGLL
jgi:MFS family permease